ncbi:hypothetical protein [Nitrospira moscoviensis]|uniref:Uncharacterized protein n=1 Tax=Nitrospira moscoviensis TaxID=42253 RepID=A0A0K2GI30_NITMO|nr:hypothetical protein [Nitrospira moscoviensis]ALA60509.1 membrane protein of unknown function [Nitrospira moscoviensis]
MAFTRPLAGRWALLFFCAASMIAIPATDAFAVAGKFTSAPPGAALSKGELTLELNEPVNGLTEVTVQVNERGEFTTPPGVEQDNIKNCRYRNDKGETTSFRCGGYLAFGGGAAGMTGLTAGLFVPGSTEFIIGGGWGTGIGATGGSSRANAGTLTGKGEHLGGGAVNILIRSFFPVEPLGIKAGAFVEFDGFFDAEGSSGIGVAHLNPAADDTRMIRKVHRAFGFGFTQVVPVGAGFFLDFQQGIAFVQQSIEGITDQSSGGGPVERFRRDFTTISPKLGASIEYQLPNWPVRVRLATEFIYLSSAGVNGFANFSTQAFAFQSRGQWFATSTFGFVIPLTSFFNAIGA